MNKRLVPFFSYRITHLEAKLTKRISIQDTCEAVDRDMNLFLQRLQYFREQIPRELAKDNYSVFEWPIRPSRLQRHSQFIKFTVYNTNSQYIKLVYNTR